ncbi:MAG: FAD-binding oxidoreductase [Phycisphaeraceae bacterium]|nr:MAG: FAD-binding oxidoreductase [Phycisphaeraceae bacterium]
MTDRRTADVIVVGAGIVGAACALALSRSGLSTLIVEPGVIGVGTTGAGMGHVVLMDDSQAQFVLTGYSRMLWDELGGALPERAARRSTGTLWVAADDHDLHTAIRRHAFYESSGVGSRLVSPAEIAQLEPNLRRDLAGGLMVMGDSVVYPPAAAAWMIERACASGARVERSAGVASIPAAGRGVELTDGSHAAAGAVVVAAGSASGGLARGLPMTPKKGHLVITDRAPGFCSAQIMEIGYADSAHGDAAESVAFNVQPRETGQVLIGSSRQAGVSDARVDRAIVSTMLERAVWFMPALASLQALRVWTGIRPATPDNLPVIGPDPRTPGLYLAFGHEGLGVTTSLGTAALIAHHIVGHAPAIDPSPYLPERFLRGGPTDA